MKNSYLIQKCKCKFENNVRISRKNVMYKLFKSVKILQYFAMKQLSVKYHIIRYCTGYSR